LGALSHPFLTEEASKPQVLKTKILDSMKKQLHSITLKDKLQSYMALQNSAQDLENKFS